MNQIKGEFSVTIQTVRMSLYYYSESQTAIKIRRRAKELLIQEANEIVD
jgi:hypothetical protein